MFGGPGLATCSVDARFGMSEQDYFLIVYLPVIAEGSFSRSMVNDAGFVLKVK